MSGGAFDYKQHTLQDLIDDMNTLIERLDKEPIDSFECNSLKNFVKNPDDLKNKIRENIGYLKRAFLFTNSLDWLISGDDGEEKFYEKLDVEMKKIEYDEIFETSVLLKKLSNQLIEERLLREEKVKESEKK